MTSPDDATREMPVLRIPGLRILKLLGEGGMGRVFLAEDETLGRRVAVKLISEKVAGEGTARARFLREARAMATIEHPSVVRIYSFGEAEGKAYLVMEYVEGETLSERLRRDSHLSLQEALRTAAQVVDGLEAAMERGVVHRDVKPANILIDGKGRVRVADFGLAKPVSTETDSSLTESGYVLGSPYPSRRSRPAAARWISVPTCTRWASCSTRCSPARAPSRGRRRSRSSANTSARRRHPCARSARSYRRRWARWWTA